jgi:predicted TIM-barrel fold metal-dependent hydrolase
MSKGYVDADGHVMEDAEDILQFVRAPYNNRGTRNWLPSLDHFHTPADGTPRTPGTFDPTIGPEQWLDFLSKTDTDYTVLYPTAGLAYGNVAYPQWALAYAQGYNDYIHKRYLQRSSRFQAVSLIPMQHVPDAVEELRRSVKALGFIGAMIPSNGLTRHVSHPEYWPIYEEAERLNCVLAVHGGSYINLGFNSFTVFPATRALGMPFPLAIAMTGMIVDGVFDHFPKLRVGFMEGGTAWIPLVLDRLEREVAYGGLKLKRRPVDYFAEERIFVGCEGNEKALAYAIERVGSKPFMFASDFPHEISISNCKEEIDEILEREDLKAEHKASILGGNARLFYER